MTTQDKHHETRRAYKAIESFIAQHALHPEAQGAYDALAWVKTYIVSLELRAERSEKANRKQQVGLKCHKPD